MDTIRSIWTDDFYWQGPDYDPPPQAGGFEGPDAVLEMFGKLQESWDDMSVVPDEFTRTATRSSHSGTCRRRPSRAAGR